MKLTLTILLALVLVLLYLRLPLPAERWQRYGARERMEEARWITLPKEWTP